MIDEKQDYPQHGYVTGSSVTGFEMAIPLRSPLARRVAFGGLVQAATADDLNVVGVVGNIVIPGDDMAVRLATRRAPVPPQALLDYQDNVTAVEVKAYTVGYYYDGQGGDGMYRGYPQRPPFPLDRCIPVEPDVARGILVNPTYVTTMFSVTRPTVPVPFMIASHILWLSENGLPETAVGVADIAGTHFKSDGETLTLISTILGMSVTPQG